MSLIQWPYLQWGDDSPVARHVSGNVCSKLKGHNGDPCVVLWGMFPNKNKKKGICRTNTSVRTAIISTIILLYNKCQS